jgi:predicted permease
MSRQTMLSFVGDLRRGARLLLKAPFFTTVAILALAIGIGGSVTVFSFASELLLRPLEVPRPDRLVRIFAAEGSTNPLVPFDDYLDYRDRNQVFSSVAAFHWGGVQRISVEGVTEQMAVSLVSGNYFETLGVRAALGRVVAPTDEPPAAAPVVVLSDVYWRRRFGADPHVVGRIILVNGTATTIVGVTPRSFKGTISPVIPQLYAPWNGHYAGPKGGLLIGRLRQDVSRDQAQADLSRIARLIGTEQNRRVSVVLSRATRLFPSLAEPATSFSALLMTVVLLVVLIACDNVALLFLARAAARQREMGIRLALGAGRAHLVRQLLAEALLLAGAGGCAAVALAYATARSLTQFYLPTPMPIALTVDFDWRVTLFAIGLSLAATLLVGLGPALRSARTDVVASLKQGGTTTGGPGAGIKPGLVVAQIAMSATLLVTAGALTRSLSSPDEAAGFSSRKVVMATVNLQAPGYTTERGIAFYERLLNRVRACGGVESAAFVDNVPLTNPIAPIDMQSEEGERSATSRGGAAPVFNGRVSSDYFRTLRIPVLAGRDFDDRDRDTAPAVGIVNETLARRFWRGATPIGRRLRQPEGPWIEVVGLVRDSKYASLGEEPKAFLYRPMAQQFVPVGTLLTRTIGNPASAAVLVRRQIENLDPELLVYNLNALEARTALNLLPNRVGAIVSSTLGGAALALGMIGTYGVMSFLVQQRRREIGLRMALGAPRSRVMGLVTGQGMRWTATGLGLGLAAGVGLTRLVAGLLFGVSAADPIALPGVAVLLGGTAYAACLIPAKRASRIDPIVALREE